MKLKDFKNVFALERIAGGFLEEDLHSFSRSFDDFNIQFNSYEEALAFKDNLKENFRKGLKVVEISPLTYPKYFIHNLRGNVFSTRFLIDNKILVLMDFGNTFVSLVCDLKDQTIVKRGSYKTLDLAVNSSERIFLSYQKN